MQIGKTYTWELLNESWFDITEEFEELLSEWHGGLSGDIPDNDDVFDDAVHALASGFRYWRFNPDQATSYEKLRALYGTLLEAYVNLMSECGELLRKADIVSARQERSQPKLITAKIKGGCIHHGIRRTNPDDKTVAA